MGKPHFAACLVLVAFGSLWGLLSAQAQGFKPKPVVGTVTGANFRAAGGVKAWKV
jgi:hypothetical protein